MMKKTLGILLVIFAVPFIALSNGDDGHADHDHGANNHGTESAGSAVGYVSEEDVTEGVVVNLSAAPNPTAGIPTKLEFFVRDVITGVPVTDLELEHEKYIHVIGVRDDLNEFLHIHPKEMEPGRWAAEYAFPKPGKYRLWSDIHRGGVTESFGHPMIVVAGAGLRSEPESRAVANVILGDYQIEIKHGDLTVGQVSELHFVIRDVVGNTVPLEPFLGAQMHLAALGSDLTSYLHAHPDDGSHDYGVIMEENSMNEEMDAAHEGFLPYTLRVRAAHAHVDEGADREGTHISFAITFPREGTYRLFAQFRPEGIELPADQSLVAAFDVTVKTQTAGLVFGGSTAPWYANARWWTLLIISLLLMTLLSYGLYQYLRVENHITQQATKVFLGIITICGLIFVGYLGYLTYVSFIM